jgi:hypothetical protein
MTSSGKETILQWSAEILIRTDLERRVNIERKTLEGKYFGAVGP